MLNTSSFSGRTARASWTTWCLRGTPTEKRLIGYLSVPAEALHLKEIASLLHVATHLNLADFLTKNMDSLVWRRWISSGWIYVEPGRYNRAEARKQLKVAAARENDRRAGLSVVKINLLCSRLEGLLGELTKAGLRVA